MNYTRQRSTDRCNLCEKISRKSQGNLRVTSPSCLPRQLALLSGNTKPKTGESCKCSAIINSFFSWFSLNGFQFKHGSKRFCNIRPQKKPKWMIHEAIFTTTQRAVNISSRKERRRNTLFYQLAKPTTIYTLAWEQSIQGLKNQPTNNTRFRFISKMCPSSPQGQNILSTLKG